MLKLLSNPHKRIAGLFDQLCIDFSRSAQHAMSRRTCKIVVSYENTSLNVCSLNQKSVIPELWAGSTKNFSDIQPAPGVKPSLASELHSLENMADPQQPATAHGSCGGDFLSEPTMHSLTRSASRDENTSPLRKRMRSDCCHGSFDFRFWEPVNTAGSSNSNGDSFKFKVLSYNVLAQYLLEVHPYLYRQCSSHCLKWQFRSMLLFEEISRLAPDILCLQEVQVSHIPTFYKRLEDMGYTGIFKQKTGHRQDGCAIYFKNSALIMKDYISVEFLQPELPILNRDNVGIAVKLVPNKMPDSPFIVATTHLLFNPKRTDVRLAQMQVFLAEIDRFSFSSRKGKGHLPIILTGDLNSMPDSAIVSLLSDGCVRAYEYRDESDWKKIGVTDNCQHLAVYLNRQKGNIKPLGANKLMIQNSDRPDSESAQNMEKELYSNNCLFNTGTIGHSLMLKSVYNQIKKDGRAEATTFQNEWITVDYIFFSSQSGLSVLERLYLPTVEECETLYCLPNETFGSDHLALGAVFELKPHSSKL